MPQSKVTVNSKLQAKLWLFIWALIVAILTYFTVGFYNFDSVKYVKIATTMMQKQQYILPFFHNVAYPDKGPILFWLFILGWKLFGINHWWPQLILALAATITLFTTLELSKLFYPAKRTLTIILPYILIGLPVWISSVAEIRVDVILMLTSVIGIYALAKVFLMRQKFYWFIYVGAITIGCLCKGPVILLYVLIPGLSFPFYKSQSLSNENNYKFITWYCSIFLYTLFAVLLILLWLVPVMQLGGQSYSHEILYGQITHRAALHDSSYFYYLIHLPLFMLPWIFYLPLYYGYKKIYSARSWLFGDWLAFFIIFISVLSFSFYGQKRIHYLMPDIPFFALLLSRGITEFIEEHHTAKRFYQQFIGTLLLGMALIIKFIPQLSIYLDKRNQLELKFIFDHSLEMTFVLIIGSFFYYFYKPKNYIQQIILIMLPFVALTLLFAILNITVKN